ncbi:MAG: hypothetical protein Kow00107_01100 [Planctomycetota bacterium]
MIKQAVRTINKSALIGMIILVFAACCEMRALPESALLGLVWQKTISSLHVIPSDEDLEKAFAILRNEIRLNRPAQDYAVFPKGNDGITTVLSLDFKSIDLPDFNPLDKLPPEGSPKKKRVAANALYRRKALKLLAARLICEGNMIEGLEPLTLLEKAVLCHSLLFDVFHEDAELPHDCTRHVYEWYFQRARKLIAEHGLEAAILQEVEKRYAQLPRAEEELQSALNEWARCADEPDRDMLRRTALKLWLVRNCPVEKILRPGSHLPIQLRGGAMRVLDEYIAPWFLTRNEILDARKAGVVPRSLAMKAEFVKHIIATNIDERFRVPMLYYCLGGIYPGYDAEREPGTYFSTRELRALRAAYKRLFAASQFSHEDVFGGTLRMELFDESDGGPAYFLGLKNLPDGQGEITIERDYVYPILSWVTDSPYGSSQFLSISREEMGLMVFLNKSGLFHWSPTTHFYSEEPDVTSSNDFAIDRTVAFDNTDEGKKDILLSELGSLVMLGNQMKSDTVTVDPESYRLGIFYRFPKTKRYVYSLSWWYRDLSRPIGKIPLFFVVVVPADSLPEDSFVCAYADFCDTVLTRSGQQVRGGRIWTAPAYERDNEEFFTHLKQRSVEIGGNTTEEWKKAKAERDAFERLFNDPPEETK